MRHKLLRRAFRGCEESPEEYACDGVRQLANVVDSERSFFKNILRGAE